MNPNRIYNLLEQYPLQIAIAFFGGCIGFWVLMRVLRVRTGFPMIAYASLLVILAGSSSFGYFQVLSKGIFRWLGLGMLCALVLVYLPRARFPQNRPTAFHAAWIGLLAFAAVTAPLSGQRVFAFLNCVAVTMLFVAAFGTVWYYASNPDGVVSLVNVVHRLGLTILMLGCAFVVLPGAATGGARFQGFFNNPNWNGIFSAMVLPIVQWKLRYPANRTEKRMSSVLVIALVLNILASGSRGSIIGAVLAGGLAQWRLGREKLLRYGLLIVPLLALALLTEVGRDYLESRASSVARLERVATLTHRTEMWEQAWPTIRNHLAFGLGLGNSRFILLSGPEAEQEAAQIGGTGATLHSEHIVVLAELGILGLLWLWTFMAAMGWTGMRMWRSPRSPLSDLGFILFCSCLVVFADSFIHGWMFSAGSPLALLFWILVALCLKSERLGRAEVSARARSIGARNAGEIPRSVSAAQERAVH